MGVGIFGALHVGKEALLTQQSAVSVTSHNLANVNTPGYSRQKAVIEPIDPQRVSGLYFGRGAEITAITKSYDKFLNNTIMLETSILGRWDIKDTYMNQAESIFNETSELGLNNMMNEFWAAWQDLADHPEGIAERVILQTQGDSIAKTFQSMMANLEDIRADANNRISDVVNTINTLTDEIAELNGQVLGTNAASSGANDITDQRQLKIEELAQYIDITVIEEADSQVTILTSASGKPLVAENLSWDMAIATDPERDNLFAIMYVEGDTQKDITDKINGGQLNGLLEIRDTIIPSYLDQMNQLAATMVAEVNKMHYGGYGLDGSTGNYFFNAIRLWSEENVKNTGDGSVIEFAVSDPTELMASDFDVKYLRTYPYTARYEIYDTINEEYVFKIDSSNSTIVFDDSTDKQTTSTADLKDGSYTGDELAVELERALEEASSSGQDYEVTYNSDTRHFSIANHSTTSVDIRWNDPNTSAADVLGFENTYTVYANTNDQIVFDDGSGGAAETATLRTGTYTADQMAAEIKRALDTASAGAGGNTYTVSYDEINRVFNIQVGVGTSDFNWTGSSAAEMIGFNVNSTAVAADQSDFTAGTVVLGNKYTESITNAGTYTHAANIFEIDATNNQIVFDDNGGGGPFTVTLQNGIYTAEELAAEIERVLEGGGNNAEFTVSYDQFRKFNIEVDNNPGGNVDLLWTNAACTAATILGFDTGSDDTINQAGPTTATGDNEAGTYRYYERTFTIESGVNDGIVFNDSGIGDGTGGNLVTATLQDGDYTGEELAAEIERVLESSVGSNGQDYIVTYNIWDGQFTIINGNNNTSSVTIDWTHINSTAGATLGFNAVATTLTVGNGTTSNNRVGDYQNYQEVDFYGMMAKFADNTAPPDIGDILHLYGVKDAANNISMDAITLSDPEKLAAALDSFDIDGENNVIIFDNDGDLTDGINYKVEIAQGRYTADELAKEIERQLEQKGADEFVIQAGVNDTIRFDDGAGVVLNAVIPPSGGTPYSGSQLAAVIETQLEAAGAAQFTVTFDDAANKFNIQVDNAAGPANEVTFYWSDPLNTAAGTLGFQTTDSLGLPNGSIESSDNPVHQNYTVSYDSSTQQFTIANNSGNVNALTMLWEHPDTTAEFTLGFNEKLYTITQGVNDQLVFDEDGGPAITITIPDGLYSGEELADRIQDQLRAQGTEEYNVNYNTTTRAFTFENPAGNTLNVLWTDVNTTIEQTLGYNNAADDAVVAAAPSSPDFIPFDIAVNSSVSSDFQTGGFAVGDNRNALAISGLKEINVMSNDTLTMDTFYNILVGQVGTEVDSTNDNIEFQTFLLQQYEERREAIAGVSIDEEMVDLIKHQQAYAAATKIISTLNTMLDQLISLKT